jgi:hypothetical protein
MNTAFVAAAALGSVRGGVIGGSARAAAAGFEGHPMAAALRRVDLAAVKPYGEALAGALIAVAGVAFWLWPAV